MAAVGVHAFLRGFLVGEGEPLSLLIEREPLSEEGVPLVEWGLLSEGVPLVERGLLSEGVPLVERGLLFEEGVPLEEGW